MAADNEKLNLISEYAWNWFSYHAAQRLTVFRFFFLTFGVVAVGYYQTITTQPSLALALSVLGFLLSILFWRLDLRTRELIKIGEELLLVVEKKVSKWGIVDVALVAKANTKKTAHATAFGPHICYSYGQIFTSIFLLMTTSALIAVIYAASKTSWFWKILACQP
jgi:hypothetical protein